MYVVAIDDEKNALDIIEEYCSKIAGITELRLFTDPVEGLNYIKQTPKVSIVFLDIRMSKISGLELVKQLPESIGIIFTTAYSDYAIKGFEFDAVDYLMKPFSFDRFNKAFKKAMKMSLLSTKEFDTSSKKILSPDDFIFVRSENRLIKIKINELLYIKAMGNYITFCTDNEKIISYNTMAEIEQQLEPYNFIRVHKSYIVSIIHIQVIEKNKIKIGNKTIPIGETYKKNVKKLLNNLL